MPCRRVRPVALLVLGALFLAAAERGAHWLLGRYLLPTRGAQWIWADGASERVHAAAFYAVRDFDLSEPPAEARLLVQGDESYVLFINGKRVGSNRYTPGAPLDEYRVASYLRERNRVAVELASERGVGGLLLSLFLDGETEPSLVSDGAWRIFRGETAGVVEAWRPLSYGEKAHVWAAPPVGRWKAPRRAEPRPDFQHVTGEALDGHEAGPLMSMRCEELDGLRCPGACRGTHSRALFDWGERVSGYLELRSEAEGEPAGHLHLLLHGEHPPDVSCAVADTVLLSPGNGTFRDPEPRSFRYLLAVGENEVRGAFVHRLRMGEGAIQPTGRSAPQRGLFGLSPPSDR